MEAPGAFKEQRDWSLQAPGTSTWQDLTYLEFFAGKGEVWSVIRADHNMAVAVDVEYLGFGSAMDINTPSGLAFHSLHSSKTFSLQLHVVLIFLKTTEDWGFEIKMTSYVIFDLTSAIFLCSIQSKPAKVGHLAYPKHEGKRIPGFICYVLQQLGTHKLRNVQEEHVVTRG